MDYVNRSEIRTMGLKLGMQQFVKDIAFLKRSKYQMLKEDFEMLKSQIRELKLIARAS